MRSLDLSLHESSAFGKAFLRCSAGGCWLQDTLLLLATIFLLAVLSAQWAAVFRAITCVAYLDYFLYPPLHLSQWSNKARVPASILSYFQLYARSSYLVNIQLLIIPQRRILHTTAYTPTILLIKNTRSYDERVINCNWECDMLQGSYTELVVGAEGLEPPTLSV